MDFWQDILYITQMAKQAYDQSTKLETLSYENLSPEQVGKRIQSYLNELEKLVLRTRVLREQYPISGEYPKRPVKDLQNITGSIRVTEYGWLHITLNTLLPHCRFESSPYLADTLNRLIQQYKEQGYPIPFFKRAMLVIDEHCNIQNRQVYDPDNRGWKVIPNVLKGISFEDDDQEHLEICLLSTNSIKAQCHIYVLPAQDSADFFFLRCEGYPIP